MYKQTTAALGGIIVDLTALSAATTVETAEAACHVTHVVSACMSSLSCSGRDACLRASDRVAAWRMLRKQQLHEWSADTGELPDG